MSKTSALETSNQAVSPALNTTSSAATLPSSVSYLLHGVAGSAASCAAPRPATAPAEAASPYAGCAEAWRTPVSRKVTVGFPTHHRVFRTCEPEAENGHSRVGPG